MSAVVEWFIAWVNAFAFELVAVIAVLAIAGVVAIFHRSLVDLAVRAERDACAETAAAIHIANRGEWSDGARHARDRIAAAIRSRGPHLTNPPAKNGTGRLPIEQLRRA
jgi:hypothetical protein